MGQQGQASAAGQAAFFLAGTCMPGWLVRPTLGPSPPAAPPQQPLLSLQHLQGWPPCMSTRVLRDLLQLLHSASVHKPCAR